MKANLLSEAIGDAPDHIIGLRKLAVAFAIGGRFDEDESESPEEILAHIEAVKVSLRREGKIPKAKKAMLLLPEHLPEVFSDTSRFAPLGEVARIEKGKTPIKQATPGPYPLVVTAANRGSCDHFDFDGAATIIPLVSSTGHGNASINRLHFQEGQFALGSILAAVFPHDTSVISARFMFEYLTSFKEELLVSRMTGTANVTLTISRIAEVPVPLISSKAQQRVDELMVLCDRLEEARKIREETRDKLTAASLARLTALDTTQASSGVSLPTETGLPSVDATTEVSDFPAHARFALEALTSLTTRADQIKTLRQTILSLAVRGKLVEQDPADEPASELLKAAAEIKNEKILGKQIRDPKMPRKMVFETEEWKAPVGWVISQVADVAHLRSGVALRSDEEKTAGELPYIKVAELSLPENSHGVCTSGRYVADDRMSDVFAKGSIIFPKRGGAIATNRKMIALADVVGDSNLMAMQPYIAEMLPFVGLWFNSFDLWALNSGTSVPQINNKDIYPLALPIPPLAEQHRIVARVDALMALCDRLEAAMATTHTTRTRLLEALVHEALEPKSDIKEAAE
ncbi:restriction endonuclease subunit S [Pseudophaeobacter flagellatus]|uniref:restriction endonuclease subunit S n=1 Tax=Pseudophaeobacter flagellatus TaxID=2899119 RepID=UPI001E3EE5DE|nr:restriction endonuclease subunit S [Pseudophaeobacter flagellatus]MCD9147187.1 restriction endonuclease subunit S [Pseudophaeobacter flagellatus]